MEADVNPEALELLDGLHAEWTSTQFGSAHNLIQLLGHHFQDPVEIGESSASAIRFRLDLTGFYLSGVGERTRCLLVGGGVTDAAKALREFWFQDTSIGGLPLVFCVSSAAALEAASRIPQGYGLVLRPDMVRDLLKDPHPKTYLKRALCTQVGRRRLSIYNICLPATGNAFFGREHDLAQVLDLHTTNFAIAGPGKIGKSSFLKRHRWNLARRKDPRSNRVFEIDFYSLKCASADNVARHIAMAIESSSRSDRVKAAELTRFLYATRCKLGGPLELLLDETDEVCGGDAFKQLGQAAKDGHVRLILAGRKGLYDYALAGGSPLGGRMKLLKLEPLDGADARNLICQPLADLGITLKEPTQLVDYILQQSGRLPHLLQFYCQHLVELSVERKLDELSLDWLQGLESRGEFSQYFLAPLFELTDPATKRVAKAMLRSSQMRFTTSEAIEVARRFGQDLDADRVRQTCDELVIQNVLAWDGGSYRVASKALKHFANQAGLLASM